MTNNVANWWKRPDANCNHNGLTALRFLQASANWKSATACVVRFLVFRNHWNPGFIFRTSFDWDSSFLQPVVDTMTSTYDSALISYYGGADKLNSAACYTSYSSLRNDSHCSNTEEQSIMKRFVKEDCRNSCNSDNICQSTKIERWASKLEEIMWKSLALHRCVIWTISTQRMKLLLRIASATDEDRNEQTAWYYVATKENETMMPNCCSLHNGIGQYVLCNI